MKFNAEAALTRIQAVEALVSRWEFEPRVEQVSVAQACGRVLAQDCHARYDLPRHRVSSFDGIAVRSGRLRSWAPRHVRMGARRAVRASRHRRRLP